MPRRTEKLSVEEKVLEEFKENSKNAEEESLRQMHGIRPSIIGLLCGDLSPQMCWKVLTLFKFMDDPETMCTMLCLFTEYIACEFNSLGLIENGGHTLNGNWGQGITNSPVNFVTQLAVCWNISLRQAALSLSKTSIQRMVRVLDESVKVFDCHGYSLLFRKTQKYATALLQEEVPAKVSIFDFTCSTYLKLPSTANVPVSTIRKIRHNFDYFAEFNEHNFYKPNQGPFCGLYNKIYVTSNHKPESESVIWEIQPAQKRRYSSDDSYHPDPQDYSDLGNLSSSTSDLDTDLNIPESPTGDAYTENKFKKSAVMKVSKQSRNCVEMDKPLYCKSTSDAQVPEGNKDLERNIDLLTSSSYLRSPLPLTSYLNSDLESSDLSDLLLTSDLSSDLDTTDLSDHDVYEEIDLWNHSWTNFDSLPPAPKKNPRQGPADVRVKEDKSPKKKQKHKGEEWQKKRGHGRFQHLQREKDPLYQ